jgi:hypothetical protein
MVAVGEAVRVVDEHRKMHVGLVTAIHGWTTPAQKEEFVARQVAQLEKELADTEIADERKMRVQEWIERAKLQLEMEFQPSSINVVYVSDDASKHDPYGNQLERLSSLSHISQQRGMAVPGRYYEFLD